jgi:hypothetical protein
MLPNSPFSRPSSSFETPVPAPGFDPGAEPLVCVSFNQAWLPYVIGSLFQLLLNTTFDLPEGSDAFNIAQQQASTLIGRFMAAGRCVPLPNLGAMEGDDQMLRVNPDNPCELQEFCGGDWVHFWGPDDCPALGGTANPTGGGPLNPSECRTYNASLNGSGQWLLPVPVNPGDTVEVLSFEGAWADGSGIWFCPDGQHYVLGHCADAVVTFGGDPLPTAPHAQIIFQSDGAFYNPLTGPVGIPSGATANSDVVFQMNDPSLSDNTGDIQFKVRVCSAAALPVGLSYFAGSGPASVNYGDTIVVTATDIGSSNFDIDITFNADVKLTVLSAGGYACICGSGVVFSEWFHPVGTSIGTLTQGTNSQPTEMPGGTVVDRWYCATCVGGATYTVTLKIEHP